MTKRPASPFLSPTQVSVFLEFDVPVRYLRGWRSYLGDTCHFCGKPAETAAHKIPYKKGILKYRLRPDFLNHRRNLLPTCKSHNKSAQWNDKRIEAYIARLRRRRKKQGIRSSL